MENQTVQLTVLHDDNGVFSNHSDSAREYGRDSFVVALNALEDYLYIGHYKPINAIFVEMSVVNSVANTLAGQFYNGTSWETLEGLVDVTKGFTRSGFISWDRNQTDQALSTVNSLELYWVRFRPSVTHSALTAIQGLNLVFADDQSLLGEYPSINSFLPTNTTSFILIHESVRDDIIQTLRNSGKRLVGGDNGNGLDPKALNQFDLLNYTEVKQAAKYHALAKIFFWVSDEVDDKWYQKGKDFQFKGDAQLNLVYISVDSNDDGIADNNERQGLQFVRIERA